MQPETLSRLVRFGIVGALVMATFMGLNWLFGRRLRKQASFLLAYPPALALHFFLNKRWTFGDAGAADSRQVGEYLTMVAATFAVQWAVFSALAAWTRLPGWLAAGIANAAQVAITYFVMQHLVFAARPAL
ncbi:MAG TPA: GtrA family protein [Opitutaceae bacterium]|nr:GtrA family protein [Opitutaceae bacterium]